MSRSELLHGERCWGPETLPGPLASVAVYRSRNYKVSRRPSLSWYCREDVTAMMYCPPRLVIHYLQRELFPFLVSEMTSKCCFNGRSPAAGGQEDPIIDWLDSLLVSGRAPRSYWLAFVSEFPTQITPLLTVLMQQLLHSKLPKPIQDKRRTQVIKTSRKFCPKNNFNIKIIILNNGPWILKDFSRSKIIT